MFFPHGVTYYPVRWNANCRSSAAELRKRLFLRKTYFSGLSPHSGSFSARLKKWPRKGPLDGCSAAAGRAAARVRSSAKNYYISVGSRQVQRSWVSIRIGRRWELNLPMVKAIYSRAPSRPTTWGNKNCVVCLSADAASAGSEVAPSHYLADDILR